MSIEHASIAFNSQGTPVAEAFDDVYFSNHDGLAETHYVFMQNNQLPARWDAFEKSHFVIAETGFGTGLNFLVACSAFLAWRAANPNAQLRQLHFVSTEKFPLTQADLTRALQAWPEFAELTAQLVTHYPNAVEGCHRIDFAGGQVKLDLWLGDIHSSLPKVHCGDDGLVDAWFLDGFAPGKNPQMWTDALFTQMARLGRTDCTFATFTAAGFVRRGLQAAGFSVDKRKGFGTKRDMLAGNLATKTVCDSRNTQKASIQICFQRAAAKLETQSPRIAIIGGGMAGANVAFALAQRGLKSQLFCAGEHLADGASGNPQGGFYPQLHTEASVASRLQALSFDFARRRYAQLLAQGYLFDHQWCGVLQLGFNPSSQARLQSLIDKHTWPTTLVESVSAAQCSEIAGLPIPCPGVFLPQGGWLSPPQLVSAMCDAARDLAQSDILTQKTLERLDRENDEWILRWQDGSHSQAEVVIFATGAQSPNLPLLNALPFRLVRGQVEAIPSQGMLANLKTVLCHKGYLTPAVEGRHALGSTYVKDDISIEYRQSEGEQNLAMHQQALSDADWIAEHTHDWQGRAAVRCTLPDHHPVSGSWPDFTEQRRQYSELANLKRGSRLPAPADLPGVYALLGLGSRGLTTAPLMAELLVSQLLGEPLPLDDDLLEAVNPNRFLIRALRRGNA